MAVLWAPAAASATVFDPSPSPSPTGPPACSEYRFDVDEASGGPIAYLPGQAVRSMAGSPKEHRPTWQTWQTWR
jgi:hypothetical protein